MSHRKLLQKVLAAPKNTRFGDMVTLVNAFGFRHLRTSGAHHIFGRKGLAEQLNLQNVGGKAKPYQIRQFMKIVERYNLQLESDE
jgi:hypothetical protein